MLHTIIYKSLFTLITVNLETCFNCRHIKTLRILQDLKHIITPVFCRVYHALKHIKMEGNLSKIPGILEF